MSSSISDLSVCFIHVRTRFEGDAFQELSHVFNTLNIPILQHEASEGLGYVYVTFATSNLGRLRQNLQLRRLIFARQLLWGIPPLKFTTDDRISPILEVAKKSLLPLAQANAFSGMAFETTDEDDAKELSGFCKALTRPLENTLNKAKLLPKGKGAAHLPRLTLVMTAPDQIWPLFADPHNSSSWPMGIPRLRFPSDAPSRSTLKLEEAFTVFLGIEGMCRMLREGMTGVDLGACPGGWTYQLVKRGLHVTAVDNGAMDSKLMATGLVTHLKIDAFKFRPNTTVDWLVCDVVEQPSRIAELISEWFIAGLCQHAIFNLKLPMKKRWQEVQECLEMIRASCTRSGIEIHLSCKQLYHDRKEVTVFATV